MDASTQTTTALVPVSDPAHPSHNAWLEILLGVFRAASVIGPAVVAITSPGNGQLAGQLGQITQVTLGQIPE